MVAAKKVMSLSINSEMQDKIKISAKKMGWSASELIRKLVTKHLDLVVNDGDEIPVILKIPNNLKGDEFALLEWLNDKSLLIAKRLSNQLPE